MEPENINQQPVQPIPQTPVPPPIQTPPPAQPVPEQPAPKSKFSFRKWPILILIILFLVVVLLGGYFVLSRKSTTQTAQNSASNQPVATQTPSPTPDPTASWKTFVSSDFGFSIKYPTTLEASENKTPFYLVDFKNAGSSVGEFSTFDILAAPDTFTPQTPSGYDFLSADVFNKLSQTSQGQSVTVGTGTFTRQPDETLGGQTAIVVSNPGTTSNLTQKRIFVKANGNIYMLVINDNTRVNSLVQILSTFKFTNSSNENVGTAITEKDNLKTINIKNDSTFSVTLPDPGDGGYKFKDPVFDNGVVILSSSSHISPSPSAALGNFGEDKWIFKAVNSGTTKLDFSIYQPFDKSSEKLQYSFILNVQ